MPLVDENSRPVRLGAKIKAKGEGTIYRVEGVPGIAVKIYHHPPSAEKVRKLRRALELGRLARTELNGLAAWPYLLVQDAATSQVRGFFMPFAPGRPLDHLYQVHERLQHFPAATWWFLLQVARNCAAAFDTLHSLGVVMADVNDGNLHATDDARICLVDCDSYQVPLPSGGCLPCSVGVALWTPPELQGNPTAGSGARTPNHDHFGLALLIFHLLFMGRHPFAGVPMSPEAEADGGTIEAAIGAYRYAFSRDPRAAGLGPPPKTLPVALLPPAVCTMFEQAFLRGSERVGARPSARAWHEALRRIKPAQCGVDSNHHFPDHLPRCPWCEQTRAGGYQYFRVGVLVFLQGSRWW